jgi:DNA-binding NarL/FixJ family response regulator
MYARHIVVVENEALLRDLIGRTLEGAGFTVSTAANAADARRACLANDPDGLVVDIELGPGPDGFDFATAITKENPEVAIVFLTNLPDPRHAGRDSKVIGKHTAYLRKSNLIDANQLIDALDAVLTDQIETKHRHDLDPSRPFASFSKKQLEVIKQIAEGMTNQQIADVRGTSVRAVEGMVSRIFEQLDIDVHASGNARVEASKKFLLATRPGE